MEAIADNTIIRDYVGCQGLSRCDGQQTNGSWLDLLRTWITVTCGSTEGMIAAMMATVDEGQKLLFLSLSTKLRARCILSDAKPRHIALRPPVTDGEERGVLIKRNYVRLFNERRKHIICNPNNPTGTVFTPRRIGIYRRLCKEFDVLVFTDEIDEHIIYATMDNGQRTTDNSSEKNSLTTTVPDHRPLLIFPWLR